MHRLSDLRGRMVILNFWSAECPHSERTDEHILALVRKWGAEVVLLAIAANGNESSALQVQAAARRGVPTVLVDADHAVADLYEAETTPHVFLIDGEGVLRYRGAVDDASFRQKQPSRLYLEDAVECLRAGRLPAVAETLAYGCAIVRAI